jgi:hypothetical protein
MEKFYREEATGILAGGKFLSMFYVTAGGVAVHNVRRKYLTHGQTAEKPRQ